MNRKNWRKHYGIMLWLVMAAVLVVSFGSMAAYTNFNSVKKVVSTGKPKDTLFSSNYLYLTGESESDLYSSRRITPTTAEENSSFTVQIYNYVYGNPSAWNTETIEYTFQVIVKARVDGNSLPDDAEKVSLKIGDNTLIGETNGAFRTYSIIGTLNNTAATQNSYTITVPNSIKDQIKLEITATPTEMTKTGNKKLAAVISMATLEATKHWTGKFLDDQSSTPDQYDGYNYEISGNGTGTVKLQWDASKLQISKWFADGKKNTGVEKNWKWLEMDVGDQTAYQFQFYRVPSVTISDWSTMNGFVKVSFTEDSSSEGSEQQSE